MKILLQELRIRTKRTTEVVYFSDKATFIYGPVGTGKSTVARLIDYCLGGKLERTPAIQQEFLSTELALMLGDHSCLIERSSEDSMSIRITWSNDDGEYSSVVAPIHAGSNTIIDAEVYNFSDLLFYLCDVIPIKVKKRTKDPDSPLIRLSFRDIWWYCYLDQDHLDSSFFRLEDPFRGRKSQDAMRFFTGLHSEVLSQIEGSLFRMLDEQNGKREAIRQIEKFMTRFGFGSESEIFRQLERAQKDLSSVKSRQRNLESERFVAMHPTDSLRVELRGLGEIIDELRKATSFSINSIEEQKSLRAELITTKVKSNRVERSMKILGGVSYGHCPQCGLDVSLRVDTVGQCKLCCSSLSVDVDSDSQSMEASRRDLNDRIDQLTDSITRRTHSLDRTKRELAQLELEKEQLDTKLQDELSRYDSGFVESVRIVDRERATLEERIESLMKLQQMPKAIHEMEGEIGSLQESIEGVRRLMEEERSKLHQADAKVAAIADKFKSIMLAVEFPGVSIADSVELSPASWKPVVSHGDISWGFWDAGSGGKKTLYNVCYALAVHEVALELDMPVPNVIIIDSPTKNISDDENPEIVKSLYREIYRLVNLSVDSSVQVLLIDSDLVEPEDPQGFLIRHMAGTEDSPKLIPYYDGP